MVWPASGCVREPDGFVLSTTTVTIGLVPVWPAWSVAIARSSYVPSVRLVVLKPMLNGGPTVPIDVHEEPPCRRYSKATVAVSASVVAEIVGVPETAAPGLFTVGDGAWLSTFTVTGAEVVELPAGSVARTWICAGPSPSEVVSQLVLAAAPLATTEPLTRKAYVSGFASDALAEMVTLLPLTKEPPAGEPTEDVGAVLSTTTTPAPPGCRSMVETLLALSVIRARRWYAPSPGTVVSQLVE